MDRRAFFCSLLFLLGDSCPLTVLDSNAGGARKLRLTSLCIDLVITYTGPGVLEVKNSQLDWGKWVASCYCLEDVPSPENKTANGEGSSLGSRNAVVLASAGRHRSPTGTQGSLDLVHVWKSVVHVDWDVPFLGTPTITATSRDDDFNVTRCILSDKPYSATVMVHWVGTRLWRRSV